MIKHKKIMKLKRANFGQKTLFFRFNFTPLRGTIKFCCFSAVVKSVLLKNIKICEKGSH